jgi:hypothetical protein
MFLKSRDYLLIANPSEDELLEKLLDFDVEKQFSNANLIKMNQLATQTNAKVYFPNQVNQLINSLLDNHEYVSIEKKITSKKPVIDVFWLLVLLCISLGAEWFTRKYRGLL